MRLSHTLWLGAVVCAAAIPPLRAQRVATRPPSSIAARLQRLEDESALRNLAYAYGRGNDAIAIRYADRDAGRQAGAVEYARAFAPDVRVEVRALGNAEPIGRLDGIPAWVDFVDKFYSGYGYSSTLHLVSNFQIDFTSDSTARVSAFALAPHFLVKTAARARMSADTSAEWMLCRYDYDARRNADGAWRIGQMRIHLEEIMRADGFFPGGQRNGK